MVGTKGGAIRTAAKRIGITEAEYVEHVDAGEKWCHRCGRWRPQAAFGRDASRGDGLKATCADCQPSRNAPGPTKPHRAEMRERGLWWCSGCVSWQSDVQGGRCRPCRNADARRRYANDPAYRSRRLTHASMRRRGVPSVPAEEVAGLLDLFDGGCAYCGAPAEAWDHIEPVSAGGQTVPWNVVPACHHCNSSKKDRDPVLWMMATRIASERMDGVFDRMALEYCP